VEHDWKPKRLRIADIREREDLQLRAGGVGRSHVKKLVEAVADGVTLPPITVAKIGNAYCVVDGFHRLEAARSSGWNAIEALVASMDLRAAEAVARVANVSHSYGKRLGNADRNKIFANYVERREHFDSAGDVKGAGAIRAELGNIYSRERVRQKLKALGVMPNDDVDYPYGHRPYRRDDDDSERDNDGGDDLDDFGAGASGELDAEHGATVREHVDAIGPLFFALGDQHKAVALGAVRDLLERMEANVAPAVNLDI
jgi:ParB-like nuclease domain